MTPGNGAEFPACVDLSAAIGSPGTSFMLRRYGEECRFTSSQLQTSLFSAKLQSYREGETKTDWKLFETVLFLNHISDDAEKCSYPTAEYFQCFL